MLELGWIAQVVRVWLDGGTMAEIGATPGFTLLLLMAGFLVMPSLILLGLGTSSWHETPLGRWFGAKPPDSDWKYRAGDTDKDGLIDF